VIPINSLDDPCLALYRNLKDKELARDGGRFIAEGEQVVRRLLVSRVKVESLLVSKRKADAIAPLVPESVPMFVASDETVQQIIGFEFHSGVLACGIRPRPSELEDVLDKSSQATQTLVVCTKITNSENLGSLIRISAGFGVAAMLLGEQCCDPFFRQTVRVSMGSAFTLPMVRSTNILADLIRLKTEFDFELVATVLAAGAQPLAEARRSPRTALIFGGEADGLEPHYIAACDRQMTIPMRLGTDSLNVAVAAGIFLYHFVDVCGATEDR
jgi:tRNA G18 (ribose-2'-O)-methylase SpoU